MLSDLDYFITSQKWPLSYDLQNNTFRTLLEEGSASSVIINDFTTTKENKHCNNNIFATPVINCIIFTTLKHINDKAKAVNMTWSTYCDYVTFYYSRNSDVTKTFPNARALDIPEGREHLIAKTMTAFRLNYEDARINQSVNWYLKADDDTYVIMENLKLLLCQYDPSKPVYLGHPGKSPILKKRFNSGGAGYVLSKAAVGVLLNKITDHLAVCREDGVMEDVTIGECLHVFG